MQQIQHLTTSIRALLIITWLFILGGLMQACAPSLDVVIVARAVIGLASGASSVLVPLYLGEVAPPNLRGAIGTMVRRFLLLCVTVMKVPKDSTD